MAWSELPVHRLTVSCATGKVYLETSSRGTAVSRGPLFQESYKPQFAGHETFPLRHGWLKKAFDAVVEAADAGETKSVFARDDAIARFGVGKNMVASMRHWAIAAGIIEEDRGSGTLRATDFGRKLFGDAGLDPYMEHPATSWLIHWRLSAYPDKTTWFWAFNHFSKPLFDREALVRGLADLASSRGWARVAHTTIKRDVECFVRTYVARPVAMAAGHEEALESPLSELGLIKAVGRRDGFRFVRGAKPTLGNGIFTYALIDFWRAFTTARTLSFEAITYEPGSPGRVFLLDESEVMERLMDLEEVTKGRLRWSETAGLKQVIRDAEPSRDEVLGYIDLDFEADGRREAA